MIIILDNLRSAYNVGAIFRTAETISVEKIFLTGNSPTPENNPLLATQGARRLANSAKGAEERVKWEKAKRLKPLIFKLQKRGFMIVAAEQNPKSQRYNQYQYRPKTALIFGGEVKGLNNEIINLCDAVVEIPMQGKGKSLNVSVAAGIIMYQAINSKLSTS